MIYQVCSIFKVSRCFDTAGCEVDALLRDDSGVFRICPTTVDDERPELAGMGWNASHSCLTLHFGTVCLELSGHEEEPSGPQTAKLSREFKV